MLKLIFLNKRLHLRALVGIAGHNPQVRQIRVIRYSQLFHPALRALLIGAVPSGRIIQLSCNRHIDDSHHGFMLIGQSNVHGELSVSFQKFLGSVQGIYHKAVRVLQSGTVIFFFLWQNSVGGKFPSEGIHNHPIGRFVRSSQGRVIRFIFHLKIGEMIVNLHNCLSCFYGTGLGGFQFFEPVHFWYPFYSI